jgi:hypothetical protein
MFKLWDQFWGISKYRRSKRTLQRELSALQQDIEHEGVEIKHLIRHIVAYFADPLRLASVSANLDTFEDIRTKERKLNFKEQADELKKLDAQYARAMQGATHEQKKFIRDLYEQRRTDLIGQ